jgi:hypothetical protein
MDEPIEPTVTIWKVQVPAIRIDAAMWTPRVMMSSAVTIDFSSAQKG